MRFPEKLILVIQDSGLSQARISRDAELHPSALSDMTAGKRRPYMDQALKLARALKVPLEYLADDSLDEPPEPQLTDDDAFVIRAVRAMGISADEAVRRIYAGALKPELVSNGGREERAYGSTFEPSPGRPDPSLTVITPMPGRPDPSLATFEPVAPLNRAKITPTRDESEASARRNRAPRPKRDERGKK